MLSRRDVIAGAAATAAACGGPARAAVHPLDNLRDYLMPGARAVFSEHDRLGYSIEPDYAGGNLIVSAWSKDYPCVPMAFCITRKSIRDGTHLGTFAPSLCMLRDYWLKAIAAVKDSAMAQRQEV